MPKDNFTRLGCSLRKARKNRGFTQEKLSEAADVSVRYIAKIEKGEVNPSYEVLEKLERALGISLDSFLNPITEQEEAMLQEIVSLFKACSFSGKRLMAATVRALANELMDTQLDHEREK